jgi:hypothetical protein
MSSMTDSKILVAPREIKDQVEKASRVLLCEASVADRLAEDITFCEIHYGQGISSWLEIADADSKTLSKTLKNSLELRLPTGCESADVHFDPPIPFALLARSLHIQENNGIRWSCATEVTSGNSAIDSVHLKFDASLSPLPNQKITDAFSTGLKISLREWNQLNEIASQFLLSEELLDQS